LKNFGRLQAKHYLPFEKGVYEGHV